MKATFVSIVYFLLLFLLFYIVSVCCSFFFIFFYVVSINYHHPIFRNNYVVTDLLKIVRSCEEINFVLLRSNKSLGEVIHFQRNESSVKYKTYRGSCRKSLPRRCPRPFPIGESDNSPKANTLLIRTRSSTTTTTIG